MINNKYLRSLYELEDRDFALSALLQALYGLHEDMLESITNDIPDISDCTKEELEFLTICATLIEYKLQELHQMNCPKWLFDNRLKFNEPYFYQRRFLDKKKEDLIKSNPDPFKNRNVYFELHAISKL